MNKLLAFLKKDFIIDTSYKLFFVFRFFNIFLSIVVYYFLSKLIGHNAYPYLSSYSDDYFSFAIIGVAFAGYLNAAINSFSESLRDAQTTGTLEFILSTPTKVTTFLFGSILWSFIIKSLDIAIYFLFSVLLFDLNISNANWLSALVITILTIISFLSFGVFGACLVVLYKRDFSLWINTIFRLLGGVLFPITILPLGVRFFSYLIPITYSLDGMRLALLKGYTLAQLYNNIMALLLFIIILTPISVYLFKYSINKARKDGTLTEY